MRGLRIFLSVVLVLLAIKTVQAGQLCLDEFSDCFVPWEDDTRNGAFFTGDTGWTKYEKSYYDTNSEATNAATALSNDGWQYENSLTIHCLGKTSGGTFNRRKKVIDGVWHYKAQVYLNPACGMAAECQLPYDETKDPPCASDRDGDGIYDWFDPLPDDPRPFNFQTIATTENGGTAYKILDSDGNVTYWKVGDLSGAITITASAPWKTSTNDWPKDAEDDEGELSPYNPAVGENGVTIPTADMPTLPYDGGIANTPTGDSDRLDDVVANTKRIADNQALQGSALKDIGDKITGQTAAQVGLLGEISDKLEGLRGG